MKPTSPPHLLTIGKIASILNVQDYKVRYIVGTRDIKPSAYAGCYRLFDREAVARIRHELNTIEARREGNVLILDDTNQKT